MEKPDFWFTNPKRKRRVFATPEAPFPVPLESWTGVRASADRWNCYQGVLRGSSVHVLDLQDMDCIYNMGFFGKGSLSARGLDYTKAQQQDEARKRKAKDNELCLKLASRRRYLMHRKWAQWSQLATKLRVDMSDKSLSDNDEYVLPYAKKRAKEVPILMVSSPELVDVDDESVLPFENIGTEVGICGSVEKYSTSKDDGWDVAMTQEEAKSYWLDNRRSGEVACNMLDDEGNVPRSGLKLDRLVEEASTTVTPNDSTADIIASDNIQTSSICAGSRIKQCIDDNDLPLCISLLECKTTDSRAFICDSRCSRRAALAADLTEGVEVSFVDLKRLEMNVLSASVQHEETREETGSKVDTIDLGACGVERSAAENINISESSTNVYTDEELAHLGIASRASCIAIVDSGFLKIGESGFWKTCANLDNDGLKLTEGSPDSKQKLENKHLCGRHCIDLVGADSKFEIAMDLQEKEEKSDTFGTDTLQRLEQVSIDICREFKHDMELGDLASSPQLTQMNSSYKQNIGSERQQEFLKVEQEISQEFFQIRQDVRADCRPELDQESLQTSREIEQKLTDPDYSSSNANPFQSDRGIDRLCLCDEDDGDMRVIDDTEDSDADTVSGRKGWRAVTKRDPYPLCEHLQLGLEEAFFLSYGLGCLVVSDCETPLGLSSMWSRFSALNPLFVPRYVAYHSLRSKGWVPKSGIKYGADFVVYKQGPAFYHSSYLVVVRPIREGDLRRSGGSLSGADMSWTSLSCMNRVTEQVSKELMIYYVIRPDSLTDADLLSPRCIAEHSVTEVIVRRWISKRERDGAEYLQLP